VFRSSFAFAAIVAAVLALSGAATAAVPKRIVSLSPSATETLYAIGAGRQIVAVDELSDYPRRAPRTKLSGYTPNVEAIAAYRPDLVVLAFDSGDAVAGLRRLGIRTVVQPAPVNLEQAYRRIRLLGAITGHRREAARLVRSLRTGIARAVASVRRRPLRVYHELTPDYYSATSRTFIGRIYTLFGLRNIADAADRTGSGYPQLSGEYIIAANPSVIVLADSKCCGQTRATVAARPGWGSIAAVRTGAVVAVDDSVASRWGPRIVQFVRAVAAALRRVPR
jgi:iron complex transport system substrate-binding protein